MLIWFHEKPHINFNTCRSQKRAPLSLGQVHSWRLGWDKDCSPVVGDRGAEAGMDRRCVGLNPHELKSLDSRGEPGWFSRAESKNPTGPTNPAGAQGAEGACGSLRENTGGVWSKSRPLGWPHRGGALKAAVWAKANGEARPALDASVRLPAKTGQLYLASSESSTGPEVSEGFKKNLRPWVPRRPWFSRMRPVLPCTRAWVAGGLEWVGGCGWPPPASIESV